MKGEEGAVLLLVLVGLALLAALAGIALRLDTAGLHGLQAEAALFDRGLVEQSALAMVAAHLGAAPDLPRDGSATVLTVDGQKVEVSVRAAEGLVNPASARLPLLMALLQAKGASPDEALDLARAILVARAAGRMAGPWDLAAVLAGRPALWQRIAPDVTFLGASATVNAALSPPDLRDALAGVAAAGVDLTRAPMQRGMYEIDLRLFPAEGAALPAVRHSVLIDKAGHLHEFGRSWPMGVAG